MNVEQLIHLNKDFVITHIFVLQWGDSIVEMGIGFPPHNQVRVTGSPFSFFIFLVVNHHLYLLVSQNLYVDSMNSSTWASCFSRLRICRVTFYIMLILPSLYIHITFLCHIISPLQKAHCTYQRRLKQFGSTSFYMFCNYLNIYT